jgi:uncharacterized protein
MAGTIENPVVYPKLEMPDNVERHTVVVWSEGKALDADVYRPKTLSVGQEVPGIVLSHGIGGDKFTGERYAAKFAASGMIALSFTHAGWGNSQGRIVPVGELPETDANNEVTARVRVIRELIDPYEWTGSFRSALDYLAGEPNVDVDRLGAWGTSYGGPTALYVAGTDDHVKALAIQVPAIELPPPEQISELGRQRAIQIARGDFSAIPQCEDSLPNLRGTPHFARMIRFNVAEQIDKIQAPTLIVDAANEKLFDIAENGGRTYERLKARGIKTYYEVVPDIDHYGIYFGGFERGSQLANDWFCKHL